MKRLITALLAAAMCFANLPVFAAENDKHTDDCSDLSAVYEKSDTWEVVKDDSEATTLGDSARYKKTTKEASWLTWYLKSLKGFEMKFYYKQQSKLLDEITVKYSADNQTWTTASPTKTTDPNKKGSWNITTFKLSDLPKGTKFVRVEAAASQFPASFSAIGEVTLTEGERLEKNDPISEPGDNSVTVNECMSLDEVYEKSVNWRVDTKESDVYNDAGRFFRVDNKFQFGEYLTYKQEGMLSVAINFYHMNSDTKPWEPKYQAPEGEEEKKPLKVEFSDDNVNWTEGTIEEGSKLSTTSNWVGSELNIKAPNGSANYVKITFGFFQKNPYEETTETAWCVTIGRVSITAKPYYRQLEGSMTAAGGTVDVNYDIPVNVSVYDNVKLILVMQDASGVITGIEQKTFNPNTEKTNIHIETQAAIPTGTKTVSAYFWNSVSGMHRIADVQTINV